MLYKVGSGLVSIPGKLDIAHSIILAISGLAVGKCGTWPPLQQCQRVHIDHQRRGAPLLLPRERLRAAQQLVERLEEHTSELQALRHLVGRLRLEKKSAGGASGAYPRLDQSGRDQVGTAVTF